MEMIVMIIFFISSLLYFLIWWNFFVMINRKSNYFRWNIKIGNCFSFIFLNYSFSICVPNKKKVQFKMESPVAVCIECYKLRHTNLTTTIDKWETKFTTTKSSSTRSLCYTHILHIHRQYLDHCLKCAIQKKQS